ncbi:MAG: hypothetical protein L7H12_01255, partial [Sulfolobales archaeon]|nr:hypothetical protein [Sulfolobales archaeon]
RVLYYSWVVEAGAAYDTDLRLYFGGYQEGSGESTKNPFKSAHCSEEGSERIKKLIIRVLPI